MEGSTTLKCLAHAHTPWAECVRVYFLHWRQVFAFRRGRSTGDRFHELSMGFLPMGPEAVPGSGRLRLPGPLRRGWLAVSLACRNICRFQRNKHIGFQVCGLPWHYVVRRRATVACLQLLLVGTHSRCPFGSIGFKANGTGPIWF